MVIDSFYLYEISPKLIILGQRYLGKFVCKMDPAFRIRTVKIPYYLETQCDHLPELWIVLYI